MKLLEKRIETWNGKRVVVYRPNPKYPQEKAYRELIELIEKIAKKMPS
jgi:hypothetical protein